MRLPTKLIAAGLAAVAAFATSAWSQVPDPVVEQLAEITVYSERLAVRIEQAEDQFFALYNQLNDDPDYRMTCGARAIRPGSRIMTRVCVPEFFITYYGGAMPYLGAPPTLSGACSRGFESTISGAPFSGGTCVPVGYEPPPLELLLIERESAWYRHMMKVVRSDARLQSMAGSLDDMHAERDALKTRYTRVQDANRKPFNGNAGPRAR